MERCEITPSRRRVSASPGSVAPCRRTAPRSGLSRPPSMRSSVVLPAPFGPKSARQSPSARVSDTSVHRRAPAVAARHRRRPRRAVRRRGDRRRRLDGAAGTCASQKVSHPSGCPRRVRPQLRQRRSFHPDPDHERYRRPAPGAPQLPAQRRLPGRRPHPVTAPLHASGRRRPRGLLGRRGGRPCSGSARGTRRSTGRRRTRKWFTGGKLNVSVNCLDRHFTARGATRPRSSGRASPATGARSPTGTCTARSNLAANVLQAARRAEGRPGRRSTCRMIPEAVDRDARLRAHRRGPLGGVRRLLARNRCATASTTRRRKVLITADGGYRRGQIVPLKRNADKALAECPTVEHVRRGAAPPERRGRRDLRRHAGGARPLVAPPHAARVRPTAQPEADGRRGPALHPLHVAARPASPRASCTPPAATSPARRAPRQHVFDLKDEDVFWCTADVGWITGHSYLVYGPLANGATCVMYEGAPDWPEQGPLLGASCERYGVTIFYTAPTAIRAFMKWGAELAEPARPVAAAAARLRRRADQSRGVDVVPRAHRRRALPDRGHLVADGDGRDHDLAAARASRPPSRARRPRRFPGTPPTLLDAHGKRDRRSAAGCWPSRKPWPSHAAHHLGRRRSATCETYFSKWAGRPDLYFPGDGAKRDDDGYFWILGPRGRRAQRRRPPHRHHGGGERAGGPPGGGRGGGGRARRTSSRARRSPRS